MCNNGVLTVTVGQSPNVFYTVVEQTDQHQSVTVQEDVLAALIARTHLEANANLKVTHLTAYWCLHRSQSILLLKQSRTD